MNAMVGCDVALKDTKASDGTCSVAFTCDSFVPTPAGNKLMKEYVRQLGKMYSVVAGKAVEDVAPCPWAALVERTPGYFQAKLNTKNFQGKKLALSHRDFSLQVFYKFQEVAPSMTKGVGPFKAWMAELHKLAPPLLPTA